jgi:phosphoserine phosphatase
LLGIPGFTEKVAGLSCMNLVQQGGELSYLLRHDPQYRRVRKQDLIEFGRRVRRKRNIALLTRLLESGAEGYHFDFYVVSAAPEEVVRSALQGIMAPEHIFGTRFRYETQSGEIESITRVPARYGKVAAVDELQLQLGLPSYHVMYVGDGSSDIHVMLHVNHRGAIAASEAKSIAQIAKRTIVSDDALCVLVPILEEIVGYEPRQIRALFKAHGVLIQEWEKVRTDWVTIRSSSYPAEAVALPAFADRTFHLGRVVPRSSNPRLLEMFESVADTVLLRSHRALERRCRLCLSTKTYTDR